MLERYRVRFSEVPTVIKVMVGFSVLFFLCSCCWLIVSLFAPMPAEDVEATGQSAVTSELPTLAPGAEVTVTETTPTFTETSPPTATEPLPPTNTSAPSATSAAALPAGTEATVTSIIDGDTIDVLLAGQEYRIRYIGMDTPERGELFYDEASEANAQLVAGQTVILVKDVSETDRYGRLLRYVYLPDGTFVNAELVRQGFAQVSTFPPDVAHENDFLALQQEARAAGQGLWAAPAVVTVTSPSLPSATSRPVLVTNTPQSGPPKPTKATALPP